MKKLIVLLLAIALLSGCAATYDGPTATEQVLTEYYVVHTVFGTTYTTREVYAYDIYGNRVTAREYDDGELTSVTHWKYDDRGNEISQVIWDHSGLIPLPESRTEITYDDQDRVLTRIYKDGWGREESRSSYTYDDINHTTTWENDQGNQLITYYDENGREIRAVSADPDGTSIETIYHYDEKGRWTGWTSTKDSAFYGGYECGFDDKDRVIWGASYDTDGTQRSYHTYTYEDSENSATRIISDGRVRTEYYDAEGRTIRIEDYSDDGELTMTQYYTYREITVPADRNE